MSISNVAGGYDTQTVTTAAKTTNTAAEKTAETNATTTSSTDNTSVIYERTTTDGKTYKTNSALVQKLKADAEQRSAQLRSLVQSMITQQGTQFAIGTDSDMWQLLRSGKLTVTEAAKKQAQEDISENGYWGVAQTSERILDFAKALTGGDPTQIDKMEKAFEKGFKAATGEWGDKLPSISQETYKAVKEGFQKWREEANVTSAE